MHQSPQRAQDHVPRNHRRAVLSVRRHAKPTETLIHASSAAMAAFSDIGSLTASKNPGLVAVREVDVNVSPSARRSRMCVCIKIGVELLDKEKEPTSVNVSTPTTCMPITMSAMQRGLTAYTQKPLTQTPTKPPADARGPRTQTCLADGHPDSLGRMHRTVVATIQRRDRQNSRGP